MKYELDYALYNETAVQAIAEGQVLIENRNATLPITKGSTVALFGRMQFHYYKSGTGSGGMVNVNRVIGIYDAFKKAEEAGTVSIYEPLCDVYRKWEETNPYVEGIGWGADPSSQKEMPLEYSVAEDAAAHSDIAVCIIGRLAGEDADNEYAEGSYLLTSAEIDMLKTVRRAFKKVVVVLNVGNIIDMKFVKECDIDAVLYAWQGGMLGGLGTVDVLTGAVNPSGRMPDTLATSLEDYPSHANFGNLKQNLYCEDIYIGYRYFETFAKDKVLYPFGYGLSYTEFLMETDSLIKASDFVSLDVSVTNIGLVPGKDVVQVYVEAPQGKLGKPSRVLVSFKKTALLQSAASQSINMVIPLRALASFDETGKAGLGTGFVIEKGTYNFYVGENVRTAGFVGSIDFEENMMVQALENALGPVKAFKRFKPVLDDGGELVLGSEETPLRKDTQKERRNRNLPKTISYTGDKGYKLSDVKNGTVSMEDFIAQLNEEELCTIIRGEGMCSKQVTAGTASAFGGISPALKKYGIPVACTDDGPSGMRLDSGMKAFSLPNGTLLASTFNPELNEKLFELLGTEMVKNKVDVLLGPGMNIHRHPLNGRNFEYFSEDPYLTGKIGAAQIRGLKQRPVTGTIKHFACNNQENERRYADAVVSERALREIYLAGFETAVKEGGADSVMTTYCPLNGVWTSGCYDLNTTILRNQWGFKGIVMTDWWAYVSEEGSENSLNDFASMVRAQNDLYMCVPGALADVGDNAYSSLKDGTLTTGELQRTAANVCSFLMDKAVFLREYEEAPEVEVINADDGFDELPADIEYIHDNEEHFVRIDLSDVETFKNSTHYFGVEVSKEGLYEVNITGCGTPSSELSQLAAVLFSNSTPIASFTFKGDGTWYTKTDKIYFFTLRNTMYLYFNLGGIKLKDITFKIKEDDNE